MNRQEKLIQLAMCFALAILAAQNIGAHSIWVSGLAFVCIFEKKIFSIIRGYVDKTQTNNRRLNDTEQRLINLKDKTYQGLRCLNNRINSHSELLGHYQARIRAMENTHTDRPQNAEAPTPSPPRTENSQARHTPPPPIRARGQQTPRNMHTKICRLRHEMSLSIYAMDLLRRPSWNRNFTTYANYARKKNFYPTRIIHQFVRTASLPVRKTKLYL